MRVAHFSDLHVKAVTLDPRRLLSKRLLGLANMLFLRAFAYRHALARQSVTRVRELAPDHVVFTGDLTSTSLEAEFRRAEAILGALGADSDRLTVLPGNHDRYTGQATRARCFERHFGRFCRGNLLLAGLELPAEVFPIVRRLDEQNLLVGIDGARPTGLFADWGEVPPPQLELLQRLLEHPQLREARVWVACHFPLFVPACTPRGLSRALRRADRLRELLRQHRKVGVFLSGHLHHRALVRPWDDHPLLCVNAGSGSWHASGAQAAAGFCTIEATGADEALLVRAHWRNRRGEWQDHLMEPEPAAK